MTLLKNSYLVLFSLILSSAHAQSAKQQVNSGKLDEQTEVITVTGKHPLRYFRGKMDQAERTFYSMYNSLVSDPKFKVTCKSVFKAGSIIAKKSCEPAYAKPLVSEQRQLDSTRLEVTQLTGNEFSTGTRYQKRMTSLKEESMKEMELLLNTYPKFRNQLQEFVDAESLYLIKRKEIFGN